MAATPDAFVHVVHSTDKVAGNASYAANGFRAISGLNAFRRYQWMADTRTVNAAGNFRGMVVSARWSTVYTVTSTAANAVGNIATVASIAANVVDLAPRFEEVHRSKDDNVTKGLRYTSLAGTVAQKTLAGIVTGGVHLIYAPLIFSCGQTAKIGKGSWLSSGGQNCAKILQDADTLVQQTADYITDPDRQARVLTRYVNFFIQ